MDTNELESVIHNTRNSGRSRGGMGDVVIAFQPYLSKFVCTFNWSNNKPIEAEGRTLEEAVLNAAVAVDRANDEE